MTKHHNLTLLILTILLGVLRPAAFAAAPATAQGFITGKGFYGITGTAVSSLTNNAKFPNNPDALFFLPYFEWNATGDITTPPGNFADNYGSEIVGYFYPPTTGDYIFYLAADDNAELYLSPTANPADKKLIARETAYSNPREYSTSAGSSDLTAKDSSQFTGTAWATKDPNTGGAKITLQQGQPYYIEALHKEGTGGDHLSVAVLDPNGAIDYSMPIPGDYLSSDRTAGAATVESQPQSQTVDERGSVTFQVLPNGTPPYTYQWQKNGTPIADATNINYTVSGAKVADSGTRYSVIVTGANGTVTSSDAVLTVTPDTVLPKLLSAKGSPDHTQVVLTFSEPVESASASTVANYSINSTDGPLNVSAAALSPSGTQVTLTTDAQTLGKKYTVLASGVKDTAAVPNTITANSKAVFFAAGKLIENNGFIVFEAENYDRNLDGLWVADTQRGTPSGGASMVLPNGAGGSEGASKLEYDLNFAQAATYVVWLRASADNGNDDSVWIHIDEDDDGLTERPFERTDGNSASFTGFQPQSDFVWRSDSQDGPDPFTIDIPAPGPRAFAIARREDGAFVDKVILTTDTTYTPTGLGPVETREGAPGLPTVTITAPTDNQKFTAGSNISLSANAAGQSGLEITRVEYSANGTVVGEATTSPFAFTWTNAPAGLYSIKATAYDELGQGAASSNVVVNVEEQGAATGARIAWVSFHSADDTPSNAAAAAGFTNAADVAYTKLLEANGHSVTRVVTSGTPNTNLLNAFDLVIISRSVPSGDYQDPPETLAWNSITTPTMILGGYIIRNSRLGLATGGTIPDTAGPIKLQVLEPNHPIFKGVALDSSGVTVSNYTTGLQTFNGTEQRGISVVTDPMSDGSTTLATVATADDPALGGTIIAEWPAGSTLANSAADTLGGKRLLFLTGSRENNGLTSEGAGIWDLTSEGAKMFLNAVTYMSGITGTPTPDAPTLSIGQTAGAISISYTGTLESADSISGPWAPVSNASSPFAVTANGPMKFYRAVKQ